LLSDISAKFRPTLPRFRRVQGQISDSSFWPDFGRFGCARLKDRADSAGPQTSRLWMEVRPMPALCWFVDVFQMI
jgi:hypothetical protein